MFNKSCSARIYWSFSTKWILNSFTWIKNQMTANPLCRSALHGSKLYRANLGLCPANERRRYFVTMFHWLDASLESVLLYIVSCTDTIPSLKDVHSLTASAYVFGTLCPSEKMTAVFRRPQGGLEGAAVHMDVVDSLDSPQSVLWPMIRDVGTGTGSLPRRSKWQKDRPRLVLAEALYLHAASST